ncbi:potassium channel family protein [Citricoccus sp. GCM10030269]|uniref:potassium channel family protein n=1 Tax=Citricoccus sp. GCM10030269 TaxID=3273388 RepID=UPI00361A8735
MADTSIPQPCQPTHPERPPESRRRSRHRGLGSLTKPFGDSASGRQAGQNVVVLGLGRFGTGLALELMESGCEVLGVDVREDTVQSLNGLLTHVVRADTTSEEAMRQLSVHEADRVVVSIGGTLEASILTTSLMIRFGIENIWAKANNESHETILRQLGVRHVVHPERDMGRRLAHLVRVSMEDYVEVEPGFVIVRTGVPRDYVGQELRTTLFREKLGVSVVAVKDQGRWLYPDRHYVLQADDTLLVAGPTRKAEAFAEKR